MQYKVEYKFYYRGVDGKLHSFRGNHIALTESEAYESCLKGRLGKDERNGFLLVFKGVKPICQNW